MNRILKFRAWAGGVMVYFDLFNTRPIRGFDDAKHIQRSAQPHLSVSDKCHIMQFTGLKDCKRTAEYTEGQDIYDGDILKDYLERHYVIEYLVDGARFICRPIFTNNWAYGYDGYPFSACSELEVIGNTHENSELIRGK